MRISHAFVSDRGRVRENNEDFCTADDRHGFYAVADGVGGHRAGEVASRAAVEAAHASAVKALAQLQRPCDPSELILVARRAVEHACDVVHDLSRPDGEHAGASTTLTLLLVDHAHAALAHVGDSRLYLARGDNFEQLSIDHTVPNELLRAGFLSAAEARRHPLRHVLSRALGSHASVVVDTLSIHLWPNDVLLLTSDGLNEAVDEVGLVRNVATEPDLEASAESLVARANTLGGRDNSTAVLVRVHGTETSPRAGAVELLETLPLFANLGVASRSRVVGAGTIVPLEAGATLISEGEMLDGLWMVVSGRAGWSGPRVSVELEPGGWFGEAALTGPRTCTGSVVAHEATRLFHLPHTGLTRLARRRPLLGVSILHKLVSGVATGQPVRPHPARHRDSGE